MKGIDGWRASAAGWPEADRLFRSDSLWRGSDAAYSVPLSDDRTLWLFGDTFLAPEPGRTRPDAGFVHNTIGIQEGADPSTARITFHHGGSDGTPDAFFPAPAGTWLWPMAGARIPVGVVVFFMRVRSARPDLPTVLDAWRSEGSLRFFEVFDWAAVLVRNPDDDPRSWAVETLDTPPAVDRIVPGAGALVDDGYLYAYGWRDGHELRPGVLRRRPRYRGWWKPRLAYVLRWPVDGVPGGLHDPEWWCGDGWDRDHARAAPVISEPATEFTVHRRGDGFVLVEASARIRIVDDLGLGFLRAVQRIQPVARLLQAVRLLEVCVSVRSGRAPQGPWSEPQRVYAPRVRRDVLVYAGKAHPQLTGADLVCTYAQNALTADRTISDETVYYPRFVRIQLG